MEKKLQLKNAKKAITVLAIVMFVFLNSLQAQQYVGSSVDGNFNTDGDLGNWSVQNSAVATVSGGLLNVTMGASGTPTKYRGDIWYNFAGTAENNITLNSTNDAYIAVKFKGTRPDATFKFEMQRVTPETTLVWDNTSWNSTDGAFTDTNGDITYYFSLTKDVDFTGGDLSYNKLHFVIADNVISTSYQVDWIATFPSTEAIEAYISTTLGVNDYKIGSKSMKIYPNPSSGNSFNIELENSYSNSKINVKVFDLLGKLVLQNDFASKSTIQVNHNLKSGIYIVKVNDTNNTKLIIK